MAGSSIFPLGKSKKIVSFQSRTSPQTRSWREPGGRFRDDDDSDNLSTTLLVDWVDFEESSWLASHLLGCSEADAHSQALEVRRTWTFLFQSTTTTWKQKAVRRAYHALPTPSWLHFYLDHPSSDSRTKRKHPNLGHILKLYPPMISYELSQHQHRGLFRYNFFKRGRFDYALFPQYGKRIRDSREYMDKSKPSSFVDVTRDRRDTVVYWTFISVVAFGVLSLLLSALGLAAGIVQAWASVRGMG